MLPRERFDHQREPEVDAVGTGASGIHAHRGGHREALAAREVLEAGLVDQILDEPGFRHDEPHRFAEHVAMARREQEIPVAVVEEHGWLGLRERTRAVGR